MAEALIRLPPDDTGKALRTQQVTVAATDVHQEVHTLAAADGTLLDPATLATQATLASVLSTLQGVLAALQATLTVGGTVTATPTGTQTVAGTVALDAPTLAALEAVTAAVTGTVALDSTTLAALEAITVSGTIALDAPTLAALENVTAAVSGAVTVSGTVAVSNFPATQPVSGTVGISGTVPVSGPLTDAQLRAANVRVADKFTAGEVLADRPGANGVLTFTFGAAVDLIWVRVDGGTTNGRIDPFGGTPTAAQGIVAEPGIPVPVTVSGSSVAVWAPAGCTVSVHGYRY